MHSVPRRSSPVFHGVKAFALVFALLTCAFLSNPARAGSWSLVCIASSYSHLDNGKNFGSVWHPPAPSTNSIGLGMVYAGTGNAVGSNSATASATLSATISFTWVPDPSLPSDPAPAQTIVQVVTNASTYGISGGTTLYGNGTEDDGFSDPPNSAGMSSGAHLVQKSGSSFNMSISLLGSDSTSVSAGSSSCFAYTSVGGVVFKVINPFTVQANSTVDNSGWDPTNPRFFSGTNCNANGSINVNSSDISQAKMLINGNLVKQFPDPNNPNATPFPSVTFDSTYFPNGTPISITYDVWGRGDTSPVEKTVTANAVNNAYLVYNSTAYVDDANGVNQAEPVADDVNTILASTNIHSSGTDGIDDRTGIMNRLADASNLYTVFVAANHMSQTQAGKTIANSYALGDCFASPLYNSDWLTNGDINTSVVHAELTLSQPSYNFIYMHGCDSGADTTFINDFGIDASSVDRGGVGFAPALAITSDNTVFTQHLWQDLATGTKLSDALALLNTSTYGAEAWTPNQSGGGTVGGRGTATANALGDANLTVTGAVYQGSAGQWYK